VQDQCLIEVSDGGAQAFDARAALVDSQDDASEASSGSERAEQGADAPQPALLGPGHHSRELVELLVGQGVIKDLVERKIIREWLEETRAFTQLA
jgi:hypothetical protein